MPTTSAHTTTARTRSARRRAMAALSAASALMNAAMATASPVSTIVVADRLGVAWGAVPNTASIAGSGIGAVLLTWVMNRRGRRASLTVGYVAAAVGAALAVPAVRGSHVAALSFAMLLLGLGNAGGMLSRYAAAELYPPQRRGFAISTVVWAATVGAVGGPLLLTPSSDAAARLGWTALTGPFLFAALASAIAVVALSGVPAGAARPVRPRVAVRDLVRTPAARSTVTVMAMGQVVMVAVMTATPLHMHLHGQRLGAVGMALSAHTLGMFALSPLTGRLLDRFGSRPVMLAGLLTLAVATGLAAAGPSGQVALRTSALFLLGFGWNLSFVGGSGRLAREVPAAERPQVEGAVDAAVWAAAAAVSLASTVALSNWGYPALAAAAGTLVLLPVLVLLRHDDRAPAGDATTGDATTGDMTTGDMTTGVVAAGQRQTDTGRGDVDTGSTRSA
ncbi:MFS transporter [Planosporangium sp. 12N6]|uniref:MFS transporter n=1 Tax=Planosporangium spinosum TaxID=3402278 RepID=UPI003CEDB7F2